MVGERQIASHLSMEDTIDNEGFMGIFMRFFTNNGLYNWLYKMTEF